MKKYPYFLIIITILILSLRLYFAFSTPNLTFDSYFHLRHIEHITAHGLPLYQDHLSYGGRNLVFLPAFHYFSAFFDLFLPLNLIAKILPNLLLILVIPLVYLIAKKITQKEKPALFAATLAGFIPLLWETNSFNHFSLFLPLTLLAIYSFMNLRKKQHLYIYLFSITILSLTSSATFLLIIGLFLYLILSKIEEKRISKAELELALFSLFLFLWLQFLFFKNVLLKEGINFFWQNIPPQIITQYFPQISIIQSLILIGFIPLLAGIFTIYRSLFQEKNRNIFLLFSLAISTTILLIIKLVEIKIALMFIAIIFTILFAQFYNVTSQYLKQTKFAKLQLPVTITLILILLLTSLYPSLSFALQQETPTNEEIESFRWLKDNTPADSFVLTSLKEGHLLTYFAQRKNIMDDQFSLIKNIETRFDNLNSMFITRYQTQAVDLLDQYHVDYIFFSPQAKKQYQLDNLAYLDDKCFVLVHSNVVQIYQPQCRIQPIES